MELRLANESHWGHSIMTQRCIIISILIVVATASNSPANMAIALVISVSIIMAE